MAGTNPSNAPSKDSADDMATKDSGTEHVETGNLNFVEIYRSYDPAYAKDAERRLLRKIDLRLMPLIVIIYLFNYLDRNSITQARLYGLQEDTHVKGALYQTAISIFSAGYIAMQLSSTLIMSRVQPSIFLVRSRPHNCTPLTFVLTYVVIAFGYRYLGCRQCLHLSPNNDNRRL